MVNVFTTNDSAERTFMPELLTHLKHVSSRRFSHSISFVIRNDLKISDGLSADSRGRSHRRCTFNLSDDNERSEKSIALYSRATFLRLEHKSLLTTATAVVRPVKYREELYRAALI